MTSELQDRVVVVTGAGGRLGRVVARALAEAGARVVAADLVAPETPSGGLSVAADLTTEAGASAAFDAAADAGPVWALVHTVGMWDGGPLVETSLDAWETQLRVNLTSTFLAFREAARRMAGGGRLVAIASAQGADRGVAEQPAYSASKAGVVRLVEAAAAELRPRGIAAVAVAPSTILFGDEGPDAPGVRAEDLADLCVRLCGSAGAVHAGATLRAYGSAG